MLPKSISIFSILILSILCFTLISCGDDDNPANSDPVLVRTFSASVGAGSYNVVWDQRNEDGDQVAEGTYKISFQAGSFSDSYTITIDDSATPGPYIYNIGDDVTISFSMATAGDYLIEIYKI